MISAALFVGDASLDLTMLADHVPAPDEKVHASVGTEAPGGVVANAAAACALAGARVTALLQLGTDAAALVIEEALHARGIETSVTFVPGRTCRVVTIIEPHGEKRLLLDPGVSMYPAAEAVAGTDLTAFSWVHTALFGAAASILIAGCRQHGKRWSIDLEPASFAGGIEGVAPLLQGAEAIFCNDRAAEIIGLDGPELWRFLGAASVLRTGGSKGARLLRREAEIVVRAPRLEAVADTTGAGDCLAGWYIGELMNGASEQQALENAVLAASLSCLTVGAMNSYPTRSDVESFRQRVEPRRPTPG